MGMGKGEVVKDQLAERRHVKLSNVLRRIAYLCCVAAALLCVSDLHAPESASAYTGIHHYSLTPSTTQAGGHPDVTQRLHFGNRQRDGGEVILGYPQEPCGCGDVRTITEHLPTGFIGNPHVIPACTLGELSTGTCPPESQAGVAEVLELYVPLYNMEPHADEAGSVAFVIPVTGVPLFNVLSARTDGDYGLDTRTTPQFHILPFIYETFYTLWGVPADPVHDDARFLTPLSGVGGCFNYPNPCLGVTGASSNVPAAPFFQNPTTCGVPLSATAVLTYYHGVVEQASTPWPATTGCDQLSFNPSMTVKPTTAQADTASGIDVDLKVPQNQSPSTPTPSQIRSTTMTLPEGFSINPNAADGKVSCSDADTAIGTLKEATCPEFSKIGTVTLDSSALPGPIPGALYLGEPKPGNRYRVILAADGFATHIKLAGSIRADPSTGRLVFSFEELPQSPLTRFNLHVFGSERGVLATPTHCGSYSVRSEFVPWNSALPNQVSTSFLEIDTGPQGGPCPKGARPFYPKLQVGSPNNTAGMHTPFSLRLRREDGEQNVLAIDLTTPPGLSATLRGIPYCPETAIALLASSSYSGLAERISPACPVQSQIGTATAGAGSGTRPIHVAGRVYLAGPYKGAPLSLVVVIPAISGPYDLGVLATRIALHVDKVSGQVTTISDPLPQIFEGIPLRTRSIQVSLDRPGFTLNPTNCEPLSVDSSLSGDEGGKARGRLHYQVANCSDLPYGPKLTLRLTGGLGRRGHPAIHAVLRTAEGEANTRRVSVTLPKGEFLDNANVGTICTRVDFARDSCPPSAVIGNVKVKTPILDQPLTGSVYLRSSRHELPDMALDIEGQIDVEAVARIESIDGRLRTTFETVPDVPLGTVVLNLKGGSKGLLQNSDDLCGTSKRAKAKFTGQNGNRFNRNIRLSLACAEAKRNRRDHRQGSAPARRAG
jgi:hypothetical protein